ncbi:subclass B1 metallo-beta-lactamase [Emticicia sp. W12TSBA100-4]|uniref:subclass B1 metallo-beta-lactamase n=1 Tax=Emticicia sp. W12TSBA100-4 TaxID=3160965 RepID=UPI0033062821
MKAITKTILLLLFSIMSLNSFAQKNVKFKPKEIYKTSSLVITQISDNAFKHVSFKQTNDFGYVPCNGVLVRNNNEVIVFDTPTNDKSAEELIKWVKETLHCQINAVIPTHFHDDCLGGLKAFHDNNIPSYANFKTIELAKENKYTVPQNGFKDLLTLKVGKESITAKFFGEGHTKDNVVGYFPSEKIMFGGCLVKELKAGKGYLGDANLAEWSNTVEKVKNAYPNVAIVVPGHGEYGDQKLLDYTINLFKAQ